MTPESLGNTATHEDEPIDHFNPFSLLNELQTEYNNAREYEYKYALEYDSDVCMNSGPDSEVEVKWEPDSEVEVRSSPVEQVEVKSEPHSEVDMKSKPDSEVDVKSEPDSEVDVTSGPFQHCPPVPAGGVETVCGVWVQTLRRSIGEDDILYNLLVRIEQRGTVLSAVEHAYELFCRMATHAQAVSLFQRTNDVHILNGEVVLRLGF